MDSETPETLRRMVDDAIKLAKELVAKQPVPARDIPHSPGVRPSSTDRVPPETGGVYLIGESERQFIYVGEAAKARTANLRTRISRHMSDSTAEGKDFRHKYALREGLPPGPEAAKLIREKCWFVWKQIDDPDMRLLVESLLIAWLRAEKQPLLDDPAPPPSRRPIDVARLVALSRGIPKDGEGA
jgi:hypothetical protein